MDKLIDATANISVVSKIEVLGFNAPAEDYQLLSDFMDDTTIFDLTDNVVDACIEIRKKYKTKLPDAIIAATALIYNLTIVSRNVADFKNIEGIMVIDPHIL